MTQTRQTIRDLEQLGALVRARREAAGLTLDRAAALLGVALLVNAQAMAWIVTGEIQLLLDAVSEMGGRVAYYIALVLLSLGSLSWVVWLMLSIDTG